MTRWGYDEVNGIVIGDIKPISFQVFYDGRPQSEKVSCYTELEAEKQGKNIITEKEKQFGGYPCYLYQDKKLWEIRIWGV